jgi:hypothetical protein
MAFAPKSMEELDLPVNIPHPDKVRDQLERLLAHPLFSNSKRYPALLAYVVDQTLSGNSASLKERTIGVEVFNRPPNYDANADPVVRITAGEVRKRLSQYYYDPAHDGEVVVELPVGSYVPAFAVREPAPAPIALPTPATTMPGAAHPRHGLHWAAITGIAFGAAVVGAALGFGYRPEPVPPPPSNIDRFWEPVTSSVNPATFCLGEPAKNIDVGAIGNFDTPIPKSNPEPLYFRLHYSGNLALADVITLTRTAAALETRHKTFRVVPASDATFAQLREGPVVLIGAFDNIWTLRITQNLRFGFESKDGVALLVDRKSPRPTSWATAWDLPYEKLSRDYAIVARIHDNTTGQPVIIAAGISEEGTEAAGEILYNPVYLDSLLARVPPDWDKKNLEAVIETQVIQGHSGPPNVLAVETW